MNIEHCRTPDKGSVVKVSDKKSKSAKIENPKNEVVSVIQVDGCVIKEGLKADYVVQFEDKRSVIIELKGRDVAHALKQVEATAVHAIANEWLQKPIGALIVASRLPPAINTIVQRGKRAHRLKYGAHLQAASSKDTWRRGDFFVD